jgi:pimeloyl-ACP methyl ester carboxylesterase
MTRRDIIASSGRAGALAAAAKLGASSIGTSLAASPRGEIMTRATPSAVSAPTVVLVHGAFADSSSWAGVIPHLQAAGITVQAPANPLRGLTADSAYLASYLSQIPGPVLLVGHSYGGAVIGDAAAKVSNVVGLVYVAAFAPAVGELVGQVAGESKDSLLGTAQLELKYPTGQGDTTASEYVVDPAKFHTVFAADLSPDQAAVLAATQRPVAAAAFSDPTTGAAWQSLPSWAVVATEDKAAGTDVVRSQAERAKAEIVEVPGSHLVMVSQPQAVTDVILAALTAVS